MAKISMLDSPPAGTLGLYMSNSIFLNALAKFVADAIAPNPPKLLAKISPVSAYSFIPMAVVAFLADMHVLLIVILRFTESDISTKIIFILDLTFVVAFSLITCFVRTLRYSIFPYAFITSIVVTYVKNEQSRPSLVLPPSSSCLAQVHGQLTPSSSLLFMISLTLDSSLWSRGNESYDHYAQTRRLGEPMYKPPLRALLPQYAEHNFDGSSAADPVMSVTSLVDGAAGRSYNQRDLRSRNEQHSHSHNQHGSQQDSPSHHENGSQSHNQYNSQSQNQQESESHNQKDPPAYNQQDSPDGSGPTAVNSPPQHDN